MFAEQYAGGAELTTEALIAASPYEVKKIQSAGLTKSNIEATQTRFGFLAILRACQKKSVII